MPRNSARRCSWSSSGARSCRVTTTDSTTPSTEWIGVALTSVLTLRPSGTDSSISSARTVSPPPRISASGNSSSATARPSLRRQVIPSSSCSRELPGVRSPPTSRLASRLNDTGRAVLASKTTTPTGEVSIRASRSVRARRSSRCVRAWTIAVAACDANITRISSSSRVNSLPPTFSPRQKLPTCTPRWRIGVACRVVDSGRSTA